MPQMTPQQKLFLQELRRGIVIIIKACAVFTGLPYSYFVPEDNILVVTIRSDGSIEPVASLGDS